MEKNGNSHEAAIACFKELLDAPLDKRLMHFGCHADWHDDDVAYMLGEIAKGVADEIGDGENGSPGKYMTVHAARIAHEAHTRGFTDDCAEAILGEIVGLVSHFMAVTDEMPNKAHPRIRQTMEAIWEAASWVGNEDRDDTD